MIDGKQNRGSACCGKKKTAAPGGGGVGCGENLGEEVAGATGLEPAASGVTGRRSNQLSYAPAFFVS